MTEQTVYEARVGPIRATIVARGGALALFKPKVANEVVRNGMRDGGVYWLRAFLPKRFSAYANRLGYRVSEKWRREKEWLMGAAVPFVGFTPPGGGPYHPTWESARRRPNGDKMITAALNGSSVKATATAKRAQLVFLIPYGHVVRPETSAAFRTVPTWEIERVAEVAAKSMDVFLHTAATGRTSSLQNIGLVSPLSARPPTVRVVGGGEPRQTGAGARRVA